MAFKRNQPFDLSPETFPLDYIEDSQLFFKVESFPVEVIQIVNQGKEIIFSDSEGKIKTVILTDNLELIKD